MLEPSGRHHADVAGRRLNAVFKGAYVSSSPLQIDARSAMNGMPAARRQGTLLPMNHARVQAGLQRAVDLTLPQVSREPPN
jgi:hypothetical protein